MKYAIVTGSTKGIGKAIALKLLENHFFVIMNYANDRKIAEEVEDELNNNYQGQFVIIQKELDSYENIMDFVAQIVEITKEIHCIVLNSATTDRTIFGNIAPENWEKVLNTNLSAPFYLVQAVSSYIAKENGRIIFIGALMGQTPHPISIAYGVSKAALHQLSKQLVKEYAGTGITVNTVAPGFVETQWQEKKPVEQKKRITDKIAVGRFAKAEEIAQLCWHVVENGYINGTVLNIDGGYDFK